MYASIKTNSVVWDILLSVSKYRNQISLHIQNDGTLCSVHMAGLKERTPNILMQR